MTQLEQNIARAWRACWNAYGFYLRTGFPVRSYPESSKQLWPIHLGPIEGTSTQLWPKYLGPSRAFTRDGVVGLDHKR